MNDVYKFDNTPENRVKILVRIMFAENLSATDIAKGTDMQKSLISNYLNNKREMGNNALIRICITFGYSVAFTPDNKVAAVKVV